MNKKIFISYSHEDENYLTTLRKHLSTLKRERSISAWTDKEILVGEDIEKEISLSLKSCDIFIALVSHHYLASPACFEGEFKMALELESDGKIIIIPIIISSCDWRHSEFGALKAIPKDGKAISTWGDENDAFTDIVEGIRKRIKSIDSDQKYDASQDKVEKIEPKLTGFKEEFSSKERRDPKSISEYIAEEVNRLPDEKIAVFLGGPDIKNRDKCKKAKLRYDIFKALEGKYDVVPGEYESLQYLQKDTGDDAQHSELKYIKNKCQAIIIIPDSPGSFCEFGLFSWHFTYGNMRCKHLVFIALVDKKYKDDESYFNEGPVKALGVHGQVIQVNYKRKNYDKCTINKIKRILSSANSQYRERNYIKYYVGRIKFFLFPINLSFKK